jgi:hypothetical protein
MEDINFDEYFPVDYTETIQYYWIYSNSVSRIQIRNAITHTPNTATFYDYIHTSKHWTKPLLRYFQSTTNITELFSSSKNITMCSDGGIRQQIAGFGVAVGIDDNIVATTHMKMAPIFNEFTSYRCEAVGMLGALALYNKLQEYIELTQGQRINTTLRLLCDNESRVKVINRTRYCPLSPKFYYTSEADILKEILVLLKYISSKGEHVVIRHITGHQDRSSTSLSPEARLNMEADRQATASLSLPTSHQLDTQNTTAIVIVDGKIVTSNHTRILRERYQLIELRNHYNNINSWEDFVFDTVWWEAHGASLHQLMPGELTTIQKYLQNRLPCNRREHIYYGYIDAACRVCGELEVQSHIFTCQQCPIRCSLRVEYIKKLRHYLENSRLNDTATNVIIMSVSAYLDGYDPPDIEEFDPHVSLELRQAFVDQENIGWDQWMKGWIAKSWVGVYEIDLLSKDHQIPHQTTKKWATQIISQTFEFVLNNWKTRNEIKHSTNDTPIAREKEKLTNKIMWQKAKVEYFPNNYLASLTREALLELPIENLKMTDSQIQILVRASKRKTCVLRDTEIE